MVAPAIVATRVPLWQVPTVLSELVAVQAPSGVYTILGSQGWTVATASEPSTSASSVLAAPLVVVAVNTWGATVRELVRTTPFEVVVSKTMLLLEGSASAAADENESAGIKVSVGAGSSEMEGSVMESEGGSEGVIESEGGSEGSSTDEEEEPKSTDRVATNGTIVIGSEAESETEVTDGVTGSEAELEGASETVVGDSAGGVSATITEVELSDELGGSLVEGSSPTGELELELVAG